MDVLALSIGAFWSQYAWPVLMFLLGLGAVVFVHELGHFIVARWVGIRVETFAIGMGPRVCGIRRKGTDYCLRMVPIGGYVKMTGQEDFGPTDGTRDDTMSYVNKSVSQRFAVIAAGVVMNIIFAAIAFVGLGLVGVEFQAPVVGTVLPDYPAAEATIVWQQPEGTVIEPAESVGIKPGDRILSLNGKRVSRFEDLTYEAILGRRRESHRMRIRREIDGQPRIGMATLGVKAGDSPSGEGTKVLKFGLQSAATLTMAKVEGALAADDGFSAGDRVVAVNGRPVQHHWQISDMERDLTGESVTVTVMPPDGEPRDVVVTPKLIMGSEGYESIFLTDGTMLRAKSMEAVPTEKDDTGKKDKDAPPRIRLTLVDGTEKVITEDDVFETSLPDVLGMGPRMRITRVEIGAVFATPAEAAQLQPEDIIVRYADETTPTLPQLREASRQHHDGTEIVVLRDGKTQPPAAIRPRLKEGDPTIGVAVMADQDHLVVASVRAGSPAAKAGIADGCLIEAVNGQSVTTWPDLINALAALEGKNVTLTGRNGAQPFEASFGKLSAEQLSADDYFYKLLPLRPFEHMMLKVKHNNPMAAIAWGCKETIYFVGMGYANLRAIVTGRVSTKELRGPLGIADIAVQVLRRDPVRFVYLMSMISVFIAVLNFMPFPVLDGGHAVLLGVEKIRGRPLNAKITNAIQVAGLVILLGLILILTWRDLVRIVGEMFW